MHRGSLEAVGRNLPENVELGNDRRGAAGVIRVGMERNGLLCDRGKSHVVLSIRGMTGRDGITLSGKAKTTLREMADGPVRAMMSGPMKPGDRSEEKAGLAKGSCLSEAETTNRTDRPTGV